MDSMMTDEQWEAPLDPETEAQIDYALAHVKDPDDEDVAVTARYDFGTDMLVLQLKTGQRLAIPREDLQGLSEASPEQVSDIEILGPGTALHWEQLMEGFPIYALRQGIYGGARWMEGLAQRRRERLQKAG